MENRSGIWSRMFLRLRRHLSFYSLSSGGSSSCTRDAVTVSTRNAHNAGFKGSLETGYYVPRILSAIGASLTPFGQESYRPNIETYSRSCWLENHLHRFGTYNPEEEPQPTLSSRISCRSIVYDLNSTISSGSTSTISLGRSSSSGETRYFNNLGISVTDCNPEIELTASEPPPPYTEEPEDPPPPYTETPDWVQPSVRTPECRGGFTETFQDQSLY